MYKIILFEKYFKVIPNFWIPVYFDPKTNTNILLNKKKEVQKETKSSVPL